LGDVRIAIPVAIIAQLSHDPGGENISSIGQAVIELAVRIESQYPLDLLLVGVDVFGEHLQLRRQGNGQARFGPNDGRRDVKTRRLHAFVDGCGSPATMRTAMAPQESLQIRARHGLQVVSGGKRLQQRQRHGPVGIRKQGQELWEVVFQARYRCLGFISLRRSAIPQAIPLLERAVELCRVA
jgi:hypothetical protein